MKKFILFSFLVFSVNYLFAQTGGENTNGQTPPTYQNPYGTNPYGTNPYGNTNNNNTNFFDNLNNDKKTEENPSTDKKDALGNPLPDNGNDENKNLDFADRNAANEGKSDEELREMYKDDPDYLKYLGLDGSEEEDENEKNVIGNTPDPSGQLYGSSFLESGTSFSSGLTTVPEDYKLGVGDEVVVSVWGSSEFQSPFTISKDGSIFPNRVGKIFLQGLSFEAARSVIRSKFKRVLPSGSNVDIVMGKIRSIRVFVYDQVNKPGMITMSALNTPLDALKRAGGLTPLGNMRDIQIRRNGMVIERIDLYQYLKNGNSGREFYMQDNDVINVGLYEKIVEAKGAFKRPMRYQLTQYGTLTDLIDLAGGTKFNARGSLIRVKTVANEKEKFQDFSMDFFDNGDDYILQDGDVISVNQINEGVSNVVSVSGSVAYPDQYQINEGERIFDLIKKAGGLTPTAYKPRAYIFRNGNTSDEAQALKIDISAYGNSTSDDNIVVQNGDLIRILSESRFDEKFFVNVTGLVRNPGYVTYKPNIKLKDVLLMAGGLELEAESGRIEISNVTDSVNRFSITGNNVNVKVVSINPDLSLDDVSEDIVIKPYDIIFVRKKKDLITQKLVQISGQVDYPGQYVLLSEKERLTSLLMRSGGLKKEAFPDGSRLMRNNYGSVVISLKDAMRNAGGKDDIILEPGDQIIIPKQDEIVQVKGNVQYPVNIKFDSDKRSVMDYVDAAGGFGERPWRSRISVKYQNGRLQRTKNFMFFKFYPKVAPGSVVSVPVRPKSDANFDLGKVLQYSITTTTSILTIILLINANK